MFDDILWTPASTTALRCGSLASDEERLERTRRAAEARARELRLPLVWPERFPADVPAAMRAASYASEQGRGAAFVLAAGRLAFCGGFDLDDPEILAEAAAAAGIGLDGCLQAVGELRRDGAIEAAGRRLLAAGANRLPALRVGRALFWGEDRVAEAAAAARLEAACRPLTATLAALVAGLPRTGCTSVGYGETSPARIRESISSSGSLRRVGGSPGGSDPRGRTRAAAARGRCRGRV